MFEFDLVADAWSWVLIEILLVGFFLTVKD